MPDLDLGWDDHRRLVPITRDAWEDNIGWRTTGVTSLHAIWSALDRYHAIIRRALVDAGQPVPPGFGQIAQVTPWIPHVVIGRSSAWQATMQATRQDGRVGFGLLVDEHRRISRAHYQRAVNPLAVTLHLRVALPALPMDRGRFRALLVTVTAPWVSDDRSGTMDQWSAAMALLWNHLADDVDAAGPKVLAACVRRGAVS
jgi:hypothetical protein